MSARLPSWFRRSLPDPVQMESMSALLAGSRLHTICETGQCPNCGECFSHGTATFLILGDVCTRHCTFCSVRKGLPSKADPQEPSHILDAAKALRLSYAVITSVTRDDLEDGGAQQFARVVDKLHRNAHPIVAEVLVPD